MPERIAFRMNLNPGEITEYEKRHDAVYPELLDALKAAGVSDYSIWHDPESDHLFGILTRSDNHSLDALPDTEVCQRWWKFMADIMQTDDNNVPTQIPLKQVFLLS